MYVYVKKTKMKVEKRGGIWVPFSKFVAKANYTFAHILSPCKLQNVCSVADSNGLKSLPSQVKVLTTVFFFLRKKSKLLLTQGQHYYQLCPTEDFTSFISFIYVIE